MTTLFISLHVLICIFLIAIILLQPGKSGGFTEGFAAAESMFGAKTNTFMIKSTTILASLFLVTCLSLALLSAKREKSLMLDKMAAHTKPIAKTMANTMSTASTEKVQGAQGIKESAINSQTPASSPLPTNEKATAPVTTEAK